MTVIGATYVVHFNPIVKVCRERPMCRSARERTELFSTNPDTRNHGTKASPRGSWQGAALTDEGRGNVKRSRNCRRIRRNVPPLCHSDGRVSGVEESTTWQKVPTQGKICNLRGFLDSLRSLGMTCRGVILFFSPQVQHPPWRAAGCRPYDTFVTNYRVFNVSIIVLRP